MSEREAVLAEVETRVRIAERQGWTNRSVPVRLLRQIAEELRKVGCEDAATEVMRQQDEKTLGAGAAAVDAAGQVVQTPQLSHVDDSGCGACCECLGRFCNADHPGHSCRANNLKALLVNTAKSFGAGYEHAKKQIRFLLFRNRQWIHPERLNALLQVIDGMDSTDGLRPTAAETATGNQASSEVLGSVPSAAQK